MAKVQYSIMPPADRCLSYWYLALGWLFCTAVLLHYSSSWVTALIASGSAAVAFLVLYTRMRLRDRAVVSKDDESIDVTAFFGTARHSLSGIQRIVTKTVEGRPSLILQGRTSAGPWALSTGTLNFLLDILVMRGEKVEFVNDCDVVLNRPERKGGKSWLWVQLVWAIPLLYAIFILRDLEWSLFFLMCYGLIASLLLPIIVVYRYWIPQNYIWVDPHHVIIDIGCKQESYDPRNMQSVSWLPLWSAPFFRTSV